MSNIGKDGHKNDRSLGEFWEEQFGYLTKKYGWTITRTSKEDGHMSKGLIVSDVRIKRDNSEFACEVKHKYQTQHGSYGLEERRVKHFLQLQERLTNCPVLYVIHDWKIAHGKKGKWTGYANDATGIVTENKEEHWFAQRLSLLEETDYVVGSGHPSYGVEGIPLIHYYEFSHFLPLTEFIQVKETRCPLVLRLPPFESYDEFLYFLKHGHLAK